MNLLLIRALSPSTLTHHLKRRLVRPAKAVCARLSNEPIALALILGFALTARVFVAVTVPPWQGPDEPKHFEYIRMLVDKRAQLWSEGRLLSVDDASPEFQSLVIASLAKHHYWEYRGLKSPSVLPSSFYDIWGDTSTQLHRSSVYYFVGAASLLPVQGASLELQLLVARLASAVLSTLTVAVTYFVGRELMSKDLFVPTVSAAFVAALPMHIFVGGTVNSDNLITLVGSVTALALAVGFKRGFTFSRLVFVLGSLALALSAKRTAVGLVPVTVIAIVGWLVTLPRRILVAGSAALALIGGLAAVAVVSGWTRGAIHLDSLVGVVSDYSLNNPNQLAMLLSVPFTSASTVALIESHLDWLFRSFWGIFGWFYVSLSPDLYRMLAIISLACALGLFGWLILQVGIQVRRPTVLRATQILTLVVFVVAILSMAALALGERLAYMSPNMVPQGRYLFVVVAPIAVLYALGARAYLPRRFVGTRIPVLMGILALVVLDVLVYSQYIAPFYSRGTSL